jgi:hypothetical protein
MNPLLLNLLEGLKRGQLSIAVRQVNGELSMGGRTHVPKRADDPITWLKALDRAPPIR